MKNYIENSEADEEIQNIEQFQMNRSAGNAAEGHNSPEPDDSEYTEEEIPFADGEGTLLDDEVAGLDDAKGDDDDFDQNETGSIDSDNINPDDIDESDEEEVL